MTELTRGQNIALNTSDLIVTIEVACPTDVSALLLDVKDQVRGPRDFVFYNQPVTTGVALRDGRLHLDLAVLDAEVQAVRCLLSVDDDAAPLGAVAPALASVAGTGRPALATFTLAGLTGERVVVVFEVYRRGGVWKLRAVGQGYSTGLSAVATAHGIEVEDAAEEVEAADPAAPSEEPVTAQPPDRIYRQVWSMFEDASRSTATLRSATDYAEQRRDQEFSALAADVTTRNSPAGQLARAAAQQRCDELIERARADHRRDMAHLLAELRVVEPALPAAMAAWTSPAWRDWRPSAAVADGIRVGELCVEEAPQLRLPMLVALPSPRPLWVDTADSPTPTAAAMARSMIVRLLAAQPLGTVRVQLADLTGGSLRAGLAPLRAAGILDAEVATTPAALSGLLSGLVERVELIALARRAGMTDSLDVDPGDRLLVLDEFPIGYDDAAIAQVRHLAENGPAAGVTLLIVGDGSDAEARGPMVTALVRSFRRLPVDDGNHIGDPWVHVEWEFRPISNRPAPVRSTR